MDVTGTDTEAITLPVAVSHTGALRQWLDDSRDYRGALTAPTIRLAVNDRIVADNETITDGDEIAFLPPVGGG